MKRKLCFGLTGLVLLVVSLVLNIACGSGEAAKTGALERDAAVISNHSLSDTFEVVDFSPDGTLSNSISYPSVQIQFSEPVISLQKLGEPSDKSPYITIEPPLKGVFRWYGTSLLSFESSDKVIPQKIYKVKVSPDLTSVSGKVITGQTEFTFHTPELRMTDLIPGYGAVQNGEYIDKDSVPPDASKDVGLSFNAPVNVDFIKTQLKVVNAATNEEIPFTAKTEKTKGKGKDSVEIPNFIRLTLNGNIPIDTSITITLPQGSSADKDCIQTSKAQTLSFHTLKPFTLKEVDSTGYDYSSYPNRVVFEFSETLKEGQEADVAKLISVDFGATVTKDNIAIEGRDLIVHSLPVKYDSKYKITINPGVKDRFDRTSTGSRTETIEVARAPSYASFKDYGFLMLEAQYNPRLAFAFQNLKKGSEYYLSALTDARGNPVNKDSISEKLDSGFPADTEIIKALDLAPQLEATSSGEYHGTVEFNASINYEYRYRNWQTKQYEYEESSRTNNQIIQVTDLGLTVRYGYNKAVVLVSSLKTGAPVANAEVSAVRIPYDYGYSDIFKKPVTTIAKATTNAQGLAVVSIPAKTFTELSKSSARLYIEAKTSDDHAIFRPDSHNMWSSAVEEVSNPYSAEEVKNVAFIYTDRGLYKPGETLSYKIIDRLLEKGNYSVYNGNYKICLQEGYWDPKVFATNEGTTTKNGTAWGTFKIPNDMKPGTYCLAYKHGDKTVDSIYFEVQFFERLRFEASASIPTMDYFVGDTLTASVSASYLGGGSLSNCSYDAWWSRSPCGFAPEGSKFDSMRFGPTQGYDGTSTLTKDDGKLNAEGKISLSQKTDATKLKGKAYRYSMHASIADSGNQSISTSASAIVHPAYFYLGLSGIKNNKGFPKKGTTLKFDYVCVTPDGKSPAASELPSNKKMTVELLREEWKEVQQMSWDGRLTTRYTREMVTESTKEINLSGSDKETELSVTPQNGGEYLLRISTKDSKDNEVITERYFYVTSSDWYWFSRDDADEIKLTTDKDVYEVGETAQLLMQSPLPKGRYLITVERDGILSEEVREIKEASTVLEFPIKESYVPVMYVAISSYSTRTENPPKDFKTPDVGKPKGYFGVAPLNVSTKTRRFEIDVKTDKSVYKPGETATIKLHASTKSGPVKDAEINLMAVDRGVIDLIGYHVQNPLDYFYAAYRFPECVSGGDSRSLLMAPVTYTSSNLVGGDSDKLDERKNFDPTALFLPAITTDANGDATCTFKLPDTLTAYRITAVGVDRDNFSIKESEMSVANPVSVRQVLPRKLRIDDKSEIGATITNLEDKGHDVEISMKIIEGVEDDGNEESVSKLVGKAELIGSDKQNVRVQAKSTQAAMFNIKAVRQGWITVEYTVRSNVVNERIVVPLEIEKPYLWEKVTTVGEVGRDEEKASLEEKIIIPGNCEDGKGEFYVQLDPTRLGVLREAVDYTFHYPYGCLEQRSSAVLPLIAFGDYIKAFGLNNEVKNPKKVALAEIKKWGDSQLSNGGFPYWPSGTYDSEYVSTRIGEILGIAMAKEMKIPDTIDVGKLANYLLGKGYEHLDKRTTYSYYAYDAVHELYAAVLLGAEVDVTKLADFLTADDVDFSTLCLCGMIYAKAGYKNRAKDALKKAKKYVSVTSQGADINAGGFDGYWSFYWNSAEKYALLLQLLCDTDPGDSLCQHVVFELLKQQRAQKGYWYSTAGTARVLTAFDEYIRANKLTKLDFTAEVLLGGNKVLSGNFKGVNAEAVETTVPFGADPLKSLSRDKEISLKFNKDGKGTLFYTTSLKYAIPLEEQTARDEGICIFTEIMDAKTGEVVKGDKLESGKIYREKVYVSSNHNRNFVAVRAPIPAGAEILNAAFATTGTLPENAAEQERDYDDDYYYDYYDYYYENSNWWLSYEGIYDTEVQYFWDKFPRGNQTVEFTFRATRKGDFSTPSATAECMYEEEIFGRSNGKKWTIE